MVFCLCFVVKHFFTTISYIKISSYYTGDVLLLGATIGIRTRDLILTMDALYQLSYRGVPGQITRQLYQMYSIFSRVKN